MTKRLVAAALIVTTIGVAQGSLLYAATMPSGLAPAVAHTLALPPDGALAAASVVLPGAAASDTSVGCLRGGNYCFGWGSWNCCTEFMILAMISAAAGNFFALIPLAYGYGAYCS